MTANGRFRIEGTDVDIMMAAEIPYTGKKAAFLIEERGALSHLVRHAGGESIEFAPEPEHKRLSVVAGPVTAALNSRQVADDFPDFESIHTPVFSATLGGDQLGRLAWVAKAMSTEETRYYLNGIYVERIDAWTVRATAIDGHRLHMLDLALPDGAGMMPEGSGVIVPRKAVHLLLRHFSGRAPVALTIGNPVRGNAPDADAAAVMRAAGAGTRISFTGSSGELALTLSTKAIDGTFPDYRRVIPESIGWAPVFEVAALRKAVAALGYGRMPVLAFTFSDSVVRISSRMSESYGEAAMEVPFTGIGPVGLHIGMNGLYLADILAGVQGDLVRMSFASASGAPSPADPIIFDEPEGGSWRGVLMPMRL